MILPASWLTAGGPWYVEIVGQPGFYATGPHGVATTERSSAISFSTYEAAAAWCRSNRVLVCVPVDGEKREGS